MGEVRQSTEASNIARCAALEAGLPENVPGFTVNRLCASAMQALFSGCQEIWCGEADVVVAAGSGFAEESELDLARELCDKLGAGLACSRPLTEGVNWLPTELYVGVSGLMLSPKAYVACGISGQMQHMVGCNRAGTMFAINKDKNAPVFKQCDYGIVGDVKDVLPKLAAAL